MTYLNSYVNKQALSSTLAVLVAIVMSYYFAWSHPYWQVAAALLVGHTSRGVPIRQGVLNLLVMVAALLLGAALNQWHGEVYLLAGIISGMFITLSVLVFFNEPSDPRKLYVSLLFFATLAMTMFLPLSQLTLSDCLMQVLTGGLISIIIHRLFLPIGFYNEFSQGVIPVLQALHEYENAAHDFFIDNNGKTIVVHKKMQIEKTLVMQEGAYPEWVYEVGFNPGLRAGYRFFLIQLEHMTELFFSMDYYIHRGIDQTLLEAIKNPLGITLQKNNELIDSLIAYFKHHTLPMTKDNYTTDMITLDEAVKKIIPNNIELIDIAPDYVSVAALVQNIKDLRRILLQLAAALPG